MVMIVMMPTPLQIVVLLLLKEDIVLGVNDLDYLNNLHERSPSNRLALPLIVTVIVLELVLEQLVIVVLLNQDNVLMMMKW